PPPTGEWPAELMLWREETPEEILWTVDRLIGSLGSGSRPRLRDLSHTLGKRATKGGWGRGAAEPTEGRAEARGSGGSPQARPRPPTANPLHGRADEGRPTLAIVTISLDDLKAKLAT